MVAGLSSKWGWNFKPWAIFLCVRSYLNFLSTIASYLEYTVFMADLQCNVGKSNSSHESAKNISSYQGDMFSELTIKISQPNKKKITPLLEMFPLAA